MAARTDTERPLLFSHFFRTGFRAKMQSANALYYAFFGVDWVLSLHFYLLCTFLSNDREHRSVIMLDIFERVAVHLYLVIY